MADFTPLLVKCTL